VSGRIEVFLRRDGGWRWRYRDSDREVVLPSNRDFRRFDDAVSSARRAYPGVRVVELRPRLLTPRVAAVAAAVVLLFLLGRARRGR
jgi:hypothetical protein